MAYHLEYSMYPPAPVLQAQFLRLGLNIGDFSEPLGRAVRQVMAPSILQNFQQGGRPRWAPLKDVTIEKKALAGAPQPSAPLIRFGTLMDVAGSYGIWNVTSTNASITDLPDADYGLVHQYGTETIPQRQFLMFQSDDIDAIERIFINWAENMFDDIGLPYGSSGAFEAAAPAAAVSEVTNVAQQAMAPAPKVGIFRKVASLFRRGR